MSASTLCHVAWHATDVSRTRAFLESIFDWTFAQVDPDYWVCRPSSGAWIGLTSSPHAGEGGAFLPQISTSDIEATCQRVLALAPNAIAERGDIPGVGLYADVRDPDGAIFSIIQFKSA